MTYSCLVREWLLYLLYSGQLFFIVMALFLVVVLLDGMHLLDGRLVAKRAAGFTALLTLPLALLAAPPLPLPLAIPTVVATAAYLFLGFGNARRGYLGFLAAALSIVSVAFELRYHAVAERTTRPSRIFVIGDSITSGGFGELHRWPELLGRSLQVPVSNLALASAGVESALERQLPELPADDSSTVIILLGGNDMLDGLSITQFEETLDRILAAARRNDRTTVVVELPLLPGRWQYGAVQRGLARKHGCVLVPKRVLARALVGRGNTFDGLHLTGRGHEVLARTLREWLRW